jgi:hypothetical protein
MRSRVIFKGMKAGFLASMCFMLATAVHAESSHVTKGSKAAGLEACVEPTPFMIRNHMKLLMHEREVAVEEGIRAEKHSLANCIQCHVAYDQQERPIPVNAEGQFCQTCHGMTAVTMDCFHCHSTVPRPTPQLGLTAPGVGIEPAEGWHHGHAGLAAVQPKGQDN